MKLALVAALLLAGCGGGTEASWCIGSGSGGVSAGYNTDRCPPSQGASRVAPAQ